MSEFQEPVEPDVGGRDVGSAWASEQEAQAHALTVEPDEVGVDVEPEDDTEDENALASEGSIQSAPLIHQLQRLVDVGGIAQTKWDEWKKLREYGVSEGAGRQLNDLSNADTIVLSTALNVIGLVFPDAQEQARNLHDRLVASAVEPTEEEQQKFVQAMRRIRMEQMAEAFGFDSVEEFQEASEASAKAFPDPLADVDADPADESDFDTGLGEIDASGE